MRIISLILVFILITAGCSQEEIDIVDKIKRIMEDRYGESFTIKQSQVIEGSSENSDTVHLAAFSSEENVWFTASYIEETGECVDNYSGMLMSELAFDDAQEKWESFTTYPIEYLCGFEVVVDDVALVKKTYTLEEAYRENQGHFGLSVAFICKYDGQDADEILMNIRHWINSYVIYHNYDYLDAIVMFMNEEMLLLYEESSLSLTTLESLESLEYSAEYLSEYIFDLSEYIDDINWDNFEQYLYDMDEYE